MWGWEDGHVGVGGWACEGGRMSMQGWEDGHVRVGGWACVEMFPTLYNFSHNHIHHTQ